MPYALNVSGGIVFGRGASWSMRSASGPGSLPSTISARGSRLLFDGAPSRLTAGTVFT
ncbi:MAG: hypothetical protein M3081_21380 [Gemmatimonadota bacterium]|nr:hypothetical protein [Gemmatimonadota bacterium]